MSPAAAQNGVETQVNWVRLGLQDYERALTTQNQQAARLQEGSSEDQTLFTVEHPPTITIGRNGSRDHILAPDEELSRLGFSVFNVDRGGDVTYHGPGQLVLYPVLHLGPWGNDVGRYVRMLEEVVMAALMEAGIEGRRLEGYPGVWVGNAKVCAIGARVKRRKDGEFVTSHGLALNVNTDLSHFQTIVPCGIVDKGVTSVAELLGSGVTLMDWEERLLAAFSDVFQVTLDEKR